MTEMTDFNIGFYDSIQDAYREYLISGPRSSKKVTSLHAYIANTLQMKLGEKYEIKSLGYGSGHEYCFNGKYYEKNLDITVLKNGTPLSAIALKFVSTNYKQNGNNYFENMLGETANVRRNDLVYGQILIIRKEMPYYSNKVKAFTHIEKINDNNFNKYLLLEDDSTGSLYHKPNLIFITLIDTGDIETISSNLNVKIDDIEEYRNKVLLPKVKIKELKADELTDLSSQTLDYIFKHNSFENFIDSFVHLTIASEYGS